MATNNFTADGGEWNTAGNWSLGHIPDSTEDTTFTGIVTPGVTLTITTSQAYCKSADFSIAGAVFTLSSSQIFNTYGSLVLKSGMTWAQTSNLYLARSYSTGTLTSNGVNLSSINAFMAGYDNGEVTLTDGLNIGTKELRLFRAQLITGNNPITCGIINDIAASGSVTLTLGSSIINCTNVSFAAATLTVSANTATVNVVPTGTVSLHLGGVSWGDATINVGASAKTVNLAAALTHTGTFTHVNGILDLKGYTITTNVYGGSANARTLQDTTGGGNIIVTGVTGTVFDVGANLTVNNTPAVQIGTSNLTQTGDVTFAGGGKTFGNFTITKHAGNYSCIITGSNTFATFTCATPDVTYQYSSVKFTAGTTTIVASFVAVGTADYTIYIASVTSATHTLSDSADTNTAQYCHISYSIAEGGATWATSNCTDGGNNTGWIFAAGLSIPIAMHHYKQMIGVG